LKITDQIISLDRSVVLIIDGKATEELSEFLEHIEDRINLSFVGTGTPEGNVTAGVGSIYHRLDGGTSTSFYVKEANVTSSGWVAK
jgi:CO dehydrogenase/acetyl-CoA synthase epsilon subunit